MTENNRGDQQFVVFRLGSEHYGLSIMVVREIIITESMTRLPKMPDYVEGIFDLRGRIIPVVNLRKRFGMVPQNLDGTSRTIVVDIEGMEAGLLVDEVVGVESISESDIQPPPDMLTAGSKVVSGVMQLNGRLVAVLDPALIASHQELRRLPAVG